MYDYDMCKIKWIEYFCEIFKSAFESFKEKTQTYFPGGNSTLLLETMNLLNEIQKFYELSWNLQNDFIKAKKDVIFGEQQYVIVKDES